MDGEALATRIEKRHSRLLKMSNGADMNEKLDLWLWAFVFALHIIFVVLVFST